MKREAANQSLDVVHEMIAMARSRIVETGFHFLLWGILVIVASLAQHFLLRVGFGEKSNLVWIGMAVVGAPIAIMYEKRRDKQGNGTTRFDRIYAQLWMGFGIALFVSIFVSIAHTVNPIPFILLLVGLATFVSGAILRFTPLVLGAVVFWITAGLSPWFNSMDFLLVYSASIFIGYVIPGLMLRNKNKANV
jgi:hypothetical protein